jgi:hypothetical protein
MGIQSHCFSRLRLAGPHVSVCFCVCAFRTDKTQLCMKSLISPPTMLPDSLILSDLARSQTELSIH